MTSSEKEVMHSKREKSYIAREDSCIAIRDSYIARKKVIHRGKEDSCIVGEKIHASREKIHLSREKKFMHCKRRFMHRGKRFIYREKRNSCIAREDSCIARKEIYALQEKIHASREKDSCIAGNEFLHSKRRSYASQEKIYPSQEDQHRLHHFSLQQRHQENYQHITFAYFIASTSKEEYIEDYIANIIYKLYLLYVKFGEVDVNDQGEKLSVNTSADSKFREDHRSDFLSLPLVFEESGGIALLVVLVSLLRRSCQEWLH
uniref:Uncharacterized protein n=1 Tax=Solanum tuberosum TaxID=4113 RepID=M1DK64_SOLTU